MIEYSAFKNELAKFIKFDEGFYEELLEKIIDNPKRYCGIFRLSNSKTKLIQNVTQSREIKFGDFIEEIVTKYLDMVGFQNMPKNLGRNIDGDELNVDQLFLKNDTVYLVEQKIRDDHDSTKKRGQFSNFVKKVQLVKQLYPAHRIDASMWFVDDSLVKNRNYYIGELNKLNVSNCILNIFYGGTLFSHLDKNEIWEDLLLNLKTLHRENASSTFEIVDFDTSDVILKVLCNLETKYWKKLMSNKEIFVTLREELFPIGHNLVEALKIRKNK